jgi:hypothetical protein
MNAYVPRYQVGERVQRDVEKFILEEVLAHHPRREEKIGCGVDFIKVRATVTPSKKLCIDLSRSF